MWFACHFNHENSTYGRKNNVTKKKGFFRHHLQYDSVLATGKDSWKNITEVKLFAANFSLASLIHLFKRICPDCTENNKIWWRNLGKIIQSVEVIIIIIDTSYCISFSINQIPIRPTRGYYRRSANHSEGWSRYDWSCNFDPRISAHATQRHP